MKEYRFKLTENRFSLAGMENLFMNTFLKTFITAMFFDSSDISANVRSFFARI